MSYATSRAASAAALRVAESGATIDEILLQVCGEVARRTERLPRAAITRTLREFHKYSMREGALGTTLRVVSELFADAQTRGELPGCTDPFDLADMLSALVIDAVGGWARGEHDQLLPVLAYRTRVLLSGVRAECTP